MTARSESQHQAALIRWLDSVAALRWPNLAMFDGRLPYFHVRNEAARGRAWRPGNRKGVPDLFLAVPGAASNGAGQRAHGLFVELKATGGRASPEQAAWIDYLTRAGYDARVCHGHAAAIAAIEEHLG